MSGAAGGAWGESSDEVRAAKDRLRILFQRLDLAGQCQRASRARQLRIPQVDAAALEQLVAVGPLTPGALGHRLGMTSGGITALAERLQEAGYVRRAPHPEDRRMRVLKATAAAEKLVAGHLQPILAPADQLISWLTDADARALVPILDALVSLKERAAEETPSTGAKRTGSRYNRDLLM